MGDINNLEFPIEKKQVTIYDSKPSITRDVYEHSIPIEAHAEYSDVMVFFHADVEMIAEIDNTQSDASTTYSRSITEGFSSSVGVGMSFEVGWEISAEIVKTNIKFGINISLTEEWSNSRTETVAFTVLPRQKAYLYQAIIKCQKMRFYHNNGKGQYLDKEGELNTDTYKTTDSVLV